MDHGIPQGPMASDFLTEVFLLPLDEAMKRTGIPYIRYVDDIRVLAKSEEDARRAAIVLEMECRRWSLIPHGSKFKASHARTIAEALGTLPSIAESTGRDVDEGELNDASAVSILRDAIKGRRPRVVDKSQLRYVLSADCSTRTRRSQEHSPRCRLRLAPETIAGTAYRTAFCSSSKAEIGPSDCGSANAIN